MVLLMLLSCDAVQDVRAVVELSTVTVTCWGFSVSSSIHSPVGPGHVPEVSKPLYAFEAHMSKYPSFMGLFTISERSWTDSCPSPQPTGSEDGSP